MTHKESIGQLALALGEGPFIIWGRTSRRFQSLRTGRPPRNLQFQLVPPLRDDESRKILPELETRRCAHCRGTNRLAVPRASSYPLTPQSSYVHPRGCPKILGQNQRHIDVMRDTSKGGVGPINLPRAQSTCCNLRSRGKWERKTEIWAGKRER